MKKNDDGTNELTYGRLKTALQRADPELPVADAIRAAFDSTEFWVCPECEHSTYQRPPMCADCGAQGEEFSKHRGAAPWE